MSWVTNIMVSAKLQDRANVEEFARWLGEVPRDYVRPNTWPPEAWEPGGVFGPGKEQPYCGDLAESPHDVWPGPKVNECTVWLGVLNHADLSAVRRHFAEIPWCLPNAVQLFLMDQEEFYFRVWMIRDGELCQYAPLKPGENDDDFWLD